MKIKKNKIIALILSITMLLSLFVKFPSVCFAENEEYTLGDVDGDGVVTSADALTVLRMSLGIIATPVSGSLDFSICDIDGSGDITSVDALLIIRKAMQSA